MNDRFRDLRNKIETLLKETKEWVVRSNIFESSKRIEEARNYLMELRKEIEPGKETDKTIERRLTGLIEYWAVRIDDILSKREEGKKEDGNIAFKCNWNDMHYKAVCSETAYVYNIGEGRAWCNLAKGNCRQYINREVPIVNPPCYESVALKGMYFGAGWDHTGETERPRHIRSAREGRMAILTTRPPGIEEEDRLVIGCLYISKVMDDPGKETMIFGDKEKSIELDYDKIKVKFWDYYKNRNAPDLKLWASQLFRYIGDSTVLNILKDIGERYANSNLNTKKIMNLISHYEEILSASKRVK